MPGQAPPIWKVAVAVKLGVRELVAVGTGVLVGLAVLDGPPVPTAEYAAAGSARPAAVTELGGKVRDAIQQRLDQLVAERGPAFS